jgi:hypothetical protein
VNRQREYCDERDVRMPFHVRLNEDSLPPQLHDTTTERFVLALREPLVTASVVSRPANAP